MILNGKKVSFSKKNLPSKAGAVMTGDLRVKKNCCKFNLSIMTSR